MAQDQTAEERIETHLHHAGIADSGDLAAAIIETLREAGDLHELPNPITTTEGAMDDREHMGFILRIFMHYIELTPNKQLTVNLEDVAQTTQGRQMQVMLDGPIFNARTIAGPIVEQKPALLI